MGEEQHEPGHAVRQAALAAGWSHRHRDVSGGWLRPTVFGAVDGLVTNTSLIAGLGGGGVSAHTVILTGVAALVWRHILHGHRGVSLGDQPERTGRRRGSCRTDHDARFPAAEEAELAEDLRRLRRRPADRGPDGRRRILDPDTALRVLTREELGVDPFELPSPLVAGVSSLIAFSAGALCRCCLPGGPGWRARAALGVAAVALLTGGMVVGRLTGRPLLASGLRQLALGALGVGVTFAVGSFIGGGHTV